MSILGSVFIGGNFVLFFVFSLPHAFSASDGHSERENDLNGYTDSVRTFIQEMWDRSMAAEIDAAGSGGRA